MRTLSNLILPAFLLGTLITTTACPSREVAAVDPRQAREQEKEVPVQINRDIDILFVIDNSGSMDEEQKSLARNFDNFINVLQAIEGGLPNVHIGVVSTDLGAGTNITGCGGGGDNGVLQNKAVGDPGCNPPSDMYIKDTANEDGSRDQNYAGGDLAATFSCIAKLGTTGCGFEQPLEATWKALNGTTAQNAGFIRDDAFLAIIIISDEDDCSTEDSQMFSTDDALNNNNSALGILSSFRCFEFGVQCDPDANPRAVGPRQDCVPRENSAYMHSVSKYIEDIKGLKKDPNQIIVAGIIGNPTPVAVAMTNDTVPEPVLTPSCQSDAGKAAPGVRLNAFIGAFPNRNAITQICNDDLSDALTVIAELLRKVIGNPCIEGDLELDDAGAPECTVSDVVNLGQDGETDTILAACNADNSNVPCYHFVKDAAQCQDTTVFPTQLTLVIERSEGNVSSNTTVVARCVAKS